MIMLLIKSIIATPNKQFDVAIISWNQHINSHYDYLFILPLYACMIFSNNIALVTNPSPFETGVIYETFSITSFNSTSPHNFPFLSRFISTSITTVPCFNHSFFLPHSRYHNIRLSHFFPKQQLFSLEDSLTQFLLKFG